MIKVMGLVGIAVGSVVGNAILPDMGPNDPDEPAPDSQESQEHLTAVDNDVFAVYMIRKDLCVQVTQMVDEGLPLDDIVDEGVAVLVEVGLVETEEGSWYLRGLLMGCAVQPMTEGEGGGTPLFAGK